MSKIKEHINKECFLIILLMLVAPPLTFAQQTLAVEDVKALHLAAESDAKRDVNKDIAGFTPFVTGLGSTLAGGMVGTITGCSILTSTSFEAQTQELLAAGAFITATSSAFFLALLMYYNDPPHPPIKRLLGKHSEYIKAYVVAYRQKMRSRQLIAASVGGAVGCTFIACWGGAVVFPEFFWASNPD